MSESQGKNPLKIPLIAVCALAVLEGLVIVVLLLRERPAEQAGSVMLPPSAGGGATAPPPAATSPAPDHSSGKSSAAPSTVPRGKVGERVESSGFGITVEKILREPGTYKDLITVKPDQQYLALLVLVENNSGGNAGLFPSTFRLQDDQGFEYEQLGIHGTMPVLEWRTMGNREKVRGYVDFIIPRSAKGLTLIYSDTSRPGAQPIQVELGR